MSNENRQAGRQPEVTVVTTLQVTHILRDCAAEEARAAAAELAYEAEEVLRQAYEENVVDIGRPDDIAVSGVQIFAFDAEPAAAERSET